MRLRHALLALYFALCTVMLVWPGYAFFGNRIEPLVLGLPVSFAWNVGWVVVTLFVLTVFHLSGREEG